SELALALGGAIKSTGTVELHGKLARLRSPRVAIDAGVGFVAEDRKRSAIFPTRSVQQNLSAAWMPRLTRLGLIHVAEEKRMAAPSVPRFGGRPPSLQAKTVQLSGGNQQKVVLGRWFALSPELVVLSEPTRGIDVGAKSEVYRLVQDMVEGGTAVLIVSSELPELLGLCDRILVMFRSRITAEFEAAGATEEDIAHPPFRRASPPQA